MAKPRPPAPNLPKPTNEARLYAVLLLGLSVLLLCGASTNPEWAGVGTLGLILIRVCYGVAGLAGIVGWVAALRGRRRGSRLVYLMAVGFPLGTMVSVFAHPIRWGCLAPPQPLLVLASTPSYIFRVRFWEARKRALLWLLVGGLVSAGVCWLVDGRSSAMWCLLVIPLATPGILLWGIAPFAGFACTVTAQGIGTAANTIVWGDIIRVCAVPLPGFSCWWLQTKGLRPSLFVPQFLDDRHDFARAVRRCAPSDHPFRRALSPSTKEAAE